MNENVVVVGFAEDSQAYQALSMLKNAAAEERVVLRSAYIVERDDSGRLNVRERLDDLDALPGTATGGLIGTLIGVLGGPLGMLLGGVTGLFIGTGADISRADRRESVLGQIAQLTPPSTTVLVAAVGEYAEEVVDAEMARLDAILARYTVAEVEAEIAAQAEATRAAEREAKRVLREQNAQERRDKRDAWWAEFAPKARKVLIGDPDAR